MSQWQTDDITVRSVQRAFAVLRAFGPADIRLPLRLVAERTGLDKATTRRLLRTLMGEGLIMQHDDNRDYSLGLGVLELVAGATPLDPLRQRAQPLLAELAETTGATTYLVVPHDQTALCIETMVGDCNAPPPLPLGARLPLHASSAPRVLLAFMPYRERMTALAAPLPALTEATPTDPLDLSQMLDRIRERGWDASQGHVERGLSSIGVPVRDATGHVVAAIGITGRDERMMEGDQPRHLDSVLAAVRDWEGRGVCAPHALADHRPPFLARPDRRARDP
jgi:DNA-binding IclR family transcriptional regulator